MYRILLLLIWATLASPVMATDAEVLSLLKALTVQVSELKDQLAQANSRISSLEQQVQQNGNTQAAVGKVTMPQTTTPTAPTDSPTVTGKSLEKPAVTVGDIKGTIKIPGTETSIGLGGFIKSDVILSDVSAGRDRIGDQALNLAQIPVGGAAGEHSQLAFHAKESRLWFKSFTPSHWGDINSYLEMDFFADPATYSYTPRLRHGYGSIGHFLAGQTWTTFLNAASLPELLDVGGSAGAISSLRQPLARWTQPFMLSGLALDWQTAIEAPRSRIWEPSANGNGSNANADNFFVTPNNERYPDIVVRLNAHPDWGTLSLAAMARQIRSPNGTDGMQHGLWGGAVNLAGKIDSFGLDNIRFMLHYGNGEGRYVSTNNTFNDASLDLDDHFQLTTTYGGMLAYQHWWNKYWRSSVSYGFAQAEPAEFVNRLLNRKVQSLHANLLWSPVSQAMLGVEYIFARRELLDEQEGDLQRIQFSARYSF